MNLKGMRFTGKGKKRKRLELMESKDGKNWVLKSVVVFYPLDVLRSLLT